MVEGNPPSVSPVQGSRQGIGHLVYMDEFIGVRRVRMKGVRLPVWLSLELADDDEGVAIEHTIRAGFQGVGRILDPIFRISLSEKFARDMDDQVKTGLVKLEDMLHR